MKIGNGNIPLRIGNLIDTKVYGGPYRQCPAYMTGVKLAAEIEFPHDISIPTEDFSVPEISDLRAGVIRALSAMIGGQHVYAGCMGGIGRTGIFLAALAKVQSEYRKLKHRTGGGEDPVLYVRRHFLPHAVETKQQEDFIAAFDVSSIVEWLDTTQTAMGLGGLSIPRNGVSDDPQADLIVEKYGQYMRTGIMDDWLSDEEPDSATEEPEGVEEARFMSLQTQIDELREDHVTLIEAVYGLVEATGVGFAAADDNFSLTKQRLWPRLRNWWNK